MTHGPIQTLRWSASPWHEDGYYVVTVRGRDRHGEAYDYNQIVEPEDHPFFWPIIREMQHHILRKIS